MFGTTDYVERKISEDERNIYDELQATDSHRPNETEPQRRWRLEHLAEQRYRAELYIKTPRRGVAEIRAEEKAEEEARKAELARINAEGIARDNAKRAAEAAEVIRLQEEAKRTVFAKPLTVEEIEARHAAERARITDPKRKVSCPACGGYVELVNGELPETHVAVTTDEQQMRITRVCRPHDEPWRA